MEELIPTGWQIVSIGEVTLPIEKTDPSRNPNQVIDYLDISGIDNKSNRILEAKHYLGKDAPSRARQLIKQEDILFSTVRTYLKNIAMVPVEYDGQVASTGFSILRAAEGINSKFLFYYILTQDFLNPLTELQRGSSYPAVRDDDVRIQKISIAPYNEQKRIVAKIDELFSELDKGIENLKTAREQLKVYRQAVLKHAFEGKLTAHWREQNTDKLETADQLLACIKRESEVYHQDLLEKWEKDGAIGKKPTTKPIKSAFTQEQQTSKKELRIYPEGWKLTELQNISDLITDGTHFTPSYVSKGVPFISVKDIREGKIHFDDCKYISEDEHKGLIQRCHPEDGDLLITKSGTIGRMAIVPKMEFSLFVSVALVKIQSAKKYISPKWLSYVFEFHLMGLNIDQEIKGGLIKNYHLEDLRLVKLPLCSFKGLKNY